MYSPTQIWAQRVCILEPIGSGRCSKRCATAGLFFQVWQHFYWVHIYISLRLSRSLFCLVELFGCSLLSSWTRLTSKGSQYTGVQIIIAKQAKCHDSQLLVNLLGWLKVQFFLFGPASVTNTPTSVWRYHLDVGITCSHTHAHTQVWLFDAARAITWWVNAELSTFSPLCYDCCWPRILFTERWASYVRRRYSAHPFTLKTDSARRLLLLLLRRSLSPINIPLAVHLANCHYISTKGFPKVSFKYLRRKCRSLDRVLLASSILTFKSDLDIAVYWRDKERSTFRYRH